MVLPHGKVPTETLRKVVFEHLGVKRDEVILGPSLGEDGALVKIGDKVLVTSMDPITGAVDRIGWLVVNVNCNDVATFGIRPSYFSSCILLPDESKEETVRIICDQMDIAAKRLGVAVIGGHTEVTPDLKRPIIVGCAMGIAELGKYVTSNGSRAGDHIILTKGSGIEGTAILATEKRKELTKKLDEKTLQTAESFYEKISVVEDAVTAFNSGGVTAMHDPTEGGVAGGIHELADASSLGVQIFENEIPIAEETLQICNFFQIDPLQLISSGALLVSSGSAHSDKIVRNLKARNIEASIIGQFTKRKSERIIKKKNGSSISLPRPTSDHLWLALQKRI